jgi:hypothetical protein
VHALDQQSRLSSRFSAKDHLRRPDDDNDSSTDPGHQLDENSTSPSDDYERRPSLSYPSDSSFAPTPREELSSFVEPLQESPQGQSVPPPRLVDTHSAGRDGARSRYPYALTHLTSNTHTTLLSDHDRHQRPPSSTTATASLPSSAHSLFDIMNMDFTSSEPPSPFPSGAGGR